MKILITTQYRENYGTESDPYWKFKGGSDYFIPGVDPLKVAPGVLVERVRDQIEHAGPMSEEYILDWQLVEDDALSPYEQDQLLLDGGVQYSAKVLELETV